jgi:hypothetical protein
MKTAFLKLLTCGVTSMAIALFAQTNLFSALDTNKLSQLILSQIKSDSPSTAVQGYNLYIAQECGGATNQLDLNNKLVALFSGDPTLASLDYRKNMDGLNTAAKNIAKLSRAAATVNRECGTETVIGVGSDELVIRRCG